MRHLCCSRPPHHPAALILAFILKKKHAGFFELGESCVPKMKMEDFAFAREEVVLDIQPIHRFKMTAENCGRNQLGDDSSFVAALLDFMEGLQPKLLVLCA